MSRWKRGSLRALLPFVLGATVGACGPNAENDFDSSDADLAQETTLRLVRITNYTLARESDLRGGGTIVAKGLSSAHHSDFLCGGKGVAMQGTGVAEDGRLVKYVSGGGGWCNGYARLCNCGSAQFTEVDRVFGSTGRSLTKNVSIAVDPRTIPHGSSVWIAALGRWFHADDSGGAIIGKHIDVYTQDENPSYFMESTVVVSRAPHEPGDPGPNGEPGDNPAAAAPAAVIEDRPEGGEFPALDVRHPVGAGGFVTQCTGVDPAVERQSERVWMTRGGGRDAGSRWAEAKYPQLALGSCGDAASGVHPLVFRSEPGGALGAAWIKTCADEGQTAHVFKVDSEVDGHPAASFQHDETDESCP